MRLSALHAIGRDGPLIQIRRDFRPAQSCHFFPPRQRQQRQPNERPSRFRHVTGRAPDRADFCIRQQPIPRHSSRARRKALEGVCCQPAPFHSPAEAGAAIGSHQARGGVFPALVIGIYHLQHPRLRQHGCRLGQVLLECQPKRAAGFGTIPRAALRQRQLLPIGYERIQRESGFGLRFQQRGLLPLGGFLLRQPFGARIKAQRNMAQLGLRSLARLGGGDSAEGPQHFPPLLLCCGVRPLDQENPRA